jgi:hypothetical protein
MESGPPWGREDWARYLRLISLGNPLTPYLTAAVERPGRDTGIWMGACCQSSELCSSFRIGMS